MLKCQSKEEKNWFSIQLKPVGSACNINCSYCYVKPFRTDRLSIMSEEVLSRTIKSCLESSLKPTFTWHGGEPLLAGSEFFLKATKIMRMYQKRKTPIKNILQTNATLITPLLANILKENKFSVSVSLDGPEKIHGIHRVDNKGKNTFHKAMKGIDNLVKAKIVPSVVCTVTQATLAYAEEVFEFLVSKGFKQIKYSPVFDSFSDNFSITSDEWFFYLKKVFDKWLEIANPEIHIRELDEVIVWIQKEKISLCSADKTCLNWVSVDPKGDLYPCEYLRSTYSHGNILSLDLIDIVRKPTFLKFKKSFYIVPRKCRDCEFYLFCGNGCPATRVCDGKLSHSGVYVYCDERKKLYLYIKKVFEKELCSGL